MHQCVVHGLSEPPRVARRETYVALLLGHFHSMFHVWRLQHDGVVGFPFLLDKLLFVICLQTELYMWAEEAENRIDLLEEPWEDLQAKPGLPIMDWSETRIYNSYSSFLSDFCPVTQYLNHIPVFGEMTTRNLSSLMHLFYLLKIYVTAHYLLK